MVYLNDDIARFDFQSALPLLSAQRREQALRFRHELGRNTCAAAYLLLREGLRAEYGVSEPPLFEYGEHGKPRLAGLPHIHFNLSHCREAALCVLSDRPVGCDIESIRQYKETLARYTMSGAELERILSAQRPDVEFTRLWTMKEAALKRSGEGLRSDMRNVLTGEEQVTTVVNEARGYVFSIIG